MFEGVSDAGVVAIIEDSTRAAAAADARRLEAIAELTDRRVDTDGEREYWTCDFWDAAAAEVAAAMGISHRAASRDMQIALTLRHRLPTVAARYAQGHLSSRLIGTITWRTHLVDDPDALAAIDIELAEHAACWEPLSVTRLEHSIDQLIDRHDPHAIRRTRTAARQRDLTIGDRDDTTGTASLWGRLFATDAALLHRRLTDMTHQVCPEDPRTTGQRRADALGALAAGADHLTCRCAKPDCPTTDHHDPRAAHVVIHVITEPPTLDAEPDPAMSGDYTATTNDTPAQTHNAALILGGGVIPAPLLADLINHGAPLQPIRPPEDQPATGYRPPAALADFVRMRDMTCRFPGCDRPAQYCDLDHTTPHPDGPTHPSNLKTLCRRHHLLKTFWGGVDGWTDHQLPDGTVIWTAPTGRTYTTHPGSKLYFPDWHTTTAALPPGAPTGRPQARGAMMPRRKRTREQDRAQRKKTERALNQEHATERNRPPPH